VDTTLGLIAVALVGLIAAGVAGWLLRTRELEGWRRKAEEQGRIAAAESTKAARVAGLERDRELARSEIARLTSQAAATEARASEQAAAAAQQIATLTQVRDDILMQFKILAGDTMKEQGETFAKQNKDQIDAVLAPLRDKITEYQTGLQSVHTESVRERASLAEQIRTLGEISAKMTQETENLTRALKGDAKTQGAWGEMMLTTILERSGLREGEEYLTQETHASEDGGRLRPDAIVRLPHGHCIVIDAKVSLTAFERYANGASDPDRAVHLDQHVASMRSHIEKLSGKEYWRIEGSQVDYVVMFVPIEAALGAALQNEPELTALAVQQQVAIATPTTLMIALRTVANVWRVERQNRNAQEIANRAGLLYDKFVGFIGDLEMLGSRLDSARNCYTAAMGKLSTGQGNLIRQAELLKQMGASTTKTIPKELIEEEGTATLLPATNGDTAPPLTT
jgi:DNA recombination protein RmuC